MKCPDDCNRHPHDPEAVVRNIVYRCEDGAGGQPRSLSVQCSFGPPGSGKSDWSLLIGNLVQKELTGHYIAPQDLKHQLRFKPKNFPTMAIHAGKHKATFCDEGSGEGGNRLQQMKTENIEVGIDLDRCRLRGQPVFWSNPTLNRLAPTVAEHATWMFDHSLDFSVQAWEVQAPNAIWGKNQYKHDRFHLARKPSLQSEFPELNKEYYTLKAVADVYGDITQQSQRERDSDRLRLVVRRVLAAHGQRPDAAD